MGNVPPVLAQGPMKMCGFCNGGIPAASQVCPLCRTVLVPVSQISDPDLRAKVIWGTVTGMGFCPACKSPNVRDASVVDNGSTHRLVWWILSLICLIAGIFTCGATWLLTLVFAAVALSARQTVHQSRACNYCNHQWPI